MAAAEADVLAGAAAAARERVVRPPGPGDSRPRRRRRSPRRRPRCVLWSCTTCCARRWAARRSSSAASWRRSSPAVRADDAGRVSLGRGLEAVRGGGVLRLRAVAAAHVCAPAVVDGAALAAAGDDGVAVAVCGRCFRAAPARGRGLDREPRSPAQAFVGLAAAPRRVTLRHPRRGERFAPLGLGGETTVARFLAAARVPRRARPRALAARRRRRASPGSAARAAAGLRRPSACGRQ